MEPKPVAAALTDIQDAVLRAIADAADLPLAEVGRDVGINDLGLDSIDFWTILMEVEDQVGADVPSEVFDRLAQLDRVPTVADILDAVAVWAADRAAG